jgi:hypothetical protein
MTLLRIAQRGICADVESAPIGLALFAADSRLISCNTPIDLLCSHVQMAEQLNGGQKNRSLSRMPARGNAAAMVQTVSCMQSENHVRELRAVMNAKQ